MKEEKFSIRKRLRSFVYAFAGIRTLLHDEHNSRIHLFAMACVIVAGIILGLSSTEWCIVALCCGGVLMAEAMNSAVEAIADLVSTEFHPLIKKAKDVGAAGVLMMAIAAAAAGLIIFLPKILSLISIP
ncbi:MAG: diacylglycerol kinase family protein [Muribaculaceae bacterium]|nr:diacylglycerol kinase family protein [Muribaculaceae bacterium]